MKQLLIVNSAKALNAGLTDSNVKDLSALQKGAITFFELGADTALSGVAKKNFGIALGNGNGAPFIIPEVDIDTLEITKTLPALGKAFKRVITVPTTVVGKEYTVIFIKKGTVPNERNRYSCTIKAGTTTAATEADKLKTEIENKVGKWFTVSIASAVLTITAKTVGEQWNIVVADELPTSAISTTAANVVNAEPTIGDKAFILNLASQCAAGKGFNLVSDEGKEIYAGYPETVEDLTPNTSGDNGASTAGYVVFNLHFATKRDAGKQLNERVWQYVHIAVPMTMASSGLSAVSAILPEGKYSNSIASSVAKSVADAEILVKVKDTALN